MFPLLFCGRLAFYEALAMILDASLEGFITATVHPPIQQHTQKFLKLYGYTLDYTLQYIGRTHVPFPPKTPLLVVPFPNPLPLRHRIPPVAMMPGPAKWELRKMEDRAWCGERWALFWYDLKMV